MRVQSKAGEIWGYFHNFRYFRCFLIAPDGCLSGKTPFVKVQGLTRRVKNSTNDLIKQEKVIPLKTIFIENIFRVARGSGDRNIYVDGYNSLDSSTEFLAKAIIVGGFDSEYLLQRAKNWIEAFFTPNDVILLTIEQVYRLDQDCSYLKNLIEK